MGSGKHDAGWSRAVWSVLRDAYLPRFGVPTRVDTVEDPDLRDEELPGDDATEEEIAHATRDKDVCYGLTFRLRGSMRAYATFGAAPWLGGCEVYFLAAAPHEEFRRVLEDLLSSNVEPGTAVRCEFWHLPFAGLLFMPIGQGSSILPAPEGGDERVLVQAVPLTADELAKARRGIPGVVERLRRAGVLEATDILRASVYAMRDGAPFWNAERIKFLVRMEDIAERWSARLQRFRDMDAPSRVIEEQSECLDELEAMLEYLRTAHPLDVPAAKKNQAKVEQRAGALLGWIMQGLESVLPDWLVPEVDMMLWFVFSTHPRAMPLFEEVVSLRALSLADKPKDVFERMRRFVKSALLPDHPDARWFAAIAKGAEKEFEAADREARPIDVDNVWLGVATHLFDEAPAGVTDREQRMRAARSAALASVARGFLPPGTAREDADDRLHAAGTAIAMDMLRGAEGLSPIFGGKLSGGRLDS